MRIGKTWRHTDFNGDTRKLQKTTTLVELIPIKPEGWMIYEGGHPMYGKMIFNRLSALNALLQKTKNITAKKKLLGIEEIMWEELPHMAPIEREAPEGAFPICKDLSDHTEVKNDNFGKPTTKPTIKQLEKTLSDLEEAPEKPMRVLKRKGKDK